MKRLKNISTRTLYYIAGVMTVVLLALICVWIHVEGKADTSKALNVSDTLDAFTPDASEQTQEDVPSEPFSEASSNESDSNNIASEAPTLVVEMTTDSVVFRVRKDAVMSALNDSGFQIHLYRDEQSINSYPYYALCSFNMMSEDEIQIRPYIEHPIANAEGGYTQNSVLVELADEYLNAKIDDDYLVASIKDTEFVEVFSSCSYYSLANTYVESESDCIASGMISDIINTDLSDDAVSTATELFAYFVTDDDAEHEFRPDTEKYRVIEIHDPAMQLPQLDFFHTRGINGDRLYYGANYENASDETADIRVIYLFSYDDFAPISCKVKVVYDTEKHMYEAGFTERIYMDELIGANEPDYGAVENVLPMIYEQCDEVFVGTFDGMLNSHSADYIKSFGVNYEGHYGSTRYFSYTPEGDGGNLIIMPMTLYGNYAGECNSRLPDKSDITDSFDFVTGEILDNGDWTLGKQVLTYASFED